MCENTEQNITDTSSCAIQPGKEWSGTGLYRHQPRWYAVYTCSRREKQVARLLEDRGVENFLPLYQRKARRFHNATRPLLPLFPGYIFVHIGSRDCLRVLQVPGVVKLLTFRGLPAEIEDHEIGAMRVVVQKGFAVHPHPYVEPGRLVEIHGGALRGTRGYVIRRNKHWRVILSVNALGQSIAVEVNEEDLAPPTDECRFAA